MASFPHFNWRDWLYYSRSERLGLLILMTGIVIAFLLPEVWLHFAPQSEQDWSSLEASISELNKRNKNMEADLDIEVKLFNFDPNTINKEVFMELGLSSRTAQSIINYRNKGGQFRKPADLAKIYTLTPEDYERLAPYIRIRTHKEEQSKESIANIESPTPPASFIFDPNTASGEDLRRLGLSDRAIKGLLRFRDKGGRFYKPEDFKQLYSVAEADKERLLPFIQITNNQETGSLAQNNQPRLEDIPQTYDNPTPIPDLYIDINQASTSDWKLLPGIGAKRAQRIVRFREALGGFISVEQVADTRYLPDSVYQQIKPFLHPSDLINKLSINTSDKTQLAKHPYLTNRQAQAIIAYRDQHGRFTDAESLEQVRAIPKEVRKKILPYLSFE